MKTFESVVFNTLVLSRCFGFTWGTRTNKPRPLVNEGIPARYNKEPQNLIEDNLLKFEEGRYLTNIIINTSTDKHIK